MSDESSMSNLSRIAKIVVAVLLLACLIDAPHGFYELVRFCATIAFCLFAWQYYVAKTMPLLVVFIVLALLFQPLAKIHLGRELWNLADVVVAIFLVVLAIAEKRPNERERDKNFSVGERNGWQSAQATSSLLRGNAINERTTRSTGSSSSLLQAVKNSDFGAVKSLIETGADVDAKNYDGLAPLHVAAGENNTEMVKLLIEAGADVNVKGKDNMTPLHVAANKNSADAAKVLIRSGADANARGKNGITPLHVAAGENKPDVARVLLDAYADLNARTDDGGTPLHHVVFNNSLSVAKLLIEAGADVNAKIYGHWWTTLHMVAHGNLISIAKLLIESGADVDIKDSEGKTALKYARSMEMLEILRRARSRRGNY